MSGSVIRTFVTDGFGVEHSIFETTSSDTVELVGIACRGDGWWFFSKLLVVPFDTLLLDLVLLLGVWDVGDGGLTAGGVGTGPGAGTWTLTLHFPLDPAKRVNIFS